MYSSNPFYFRPDPFQPFSMVVGFDPFIRGQLRRAFYATFPHVVVLQPIRTTLSLMDILAASHPLNFQRGLDTYNLRQKIESHEKQRAAKFFDPANLERVGRRAGYFTFVADLKEMTRNPGAYSERQKLRMLQFVANAYNDHIGAPHLTVHLFNGLEHQMGSYTPGGNSLRVNRNNSAFRNDFAELIDTVVHECSHNAQYNPNRYSDPLLSRVYRANFASYCKASTHGYQAYRFQPIEIGAFAAGDTAKRLMRDLAYANDNRPGMHYGKRPVWGYNVA